MISTQIPILFLEDGSESPLQGNQSPNATPMRGLSPRCKEELSALRAILQNYPYIFGAASCGIAAILSRAAPNCMFALIAILRMRIEADHLIALVLYHADSCIRSTTKLHLVVARLGVTDMGGLIALMRTPLSPDRPLRKHSGRRSLQSSTAQWLGNASGSPPASRSLAEHPAMPLFLRRVREFADRLCATGVLDERATVMAEKALRDTGRLRALNKKVTEWCDAVLALEKQAQGAFGAVAIGDVDKCMDEVKALAAALGMDVDTGAACGVEQVRSCPTRSHVPERVDSVRYYRSELSPASAVPSRLQSRTVRR